MGSKPANIDSPVFWSKNGSGEETGNLHDDVGLPSDAILILLRDVESYSWDLSGMARMSIENTLFLCNEMSRRLDQSEKT